ncbi:manganese and iron superoxide dismutase [Xylaria nigripes]|nr:manganese and iron superoxide dismutase [Xylaria nigripes]
MLRPRLRIPRAGALLRHAALFKRSEHTVPGLDQFKAEEGVPGLLSPAGFSTAWSEYMHHITDKLNVITAGTDYGMQTPLTVLKSAARNPAEAATFNYASMAHNNHFFFHQLLNLQTLINRKSAALGETGDTQQSAELEPSEERIPPRLQQALIANFSSIETFRVEMLTTAMAMFGPGFVWLVKTPTTAQMRIMVTYLAGTPYTTAHWRRQSADMNTLSGDRETVGGYYKRTQIGAGNSGYRFGSSEAPGGTDVIPLLCLNTWEHVWLTDYGVQGKGMYVQQWWETIDWDKVSALAFPREQNDFDVGL